MSNNYRKFGDYEVENPICCVSLNREKINKDEMYSNQVWVYFKSLEDKKIYRYNFMFVEDTYWYQSPEDEDSSIGSVNVE